MEKVKITRSINSNTSTLYRFLLLLKGEGRGILRVPYVDLLFFSSSFHLSYSSLIQNIIIAFMSVSLLDIIS